MGRKVTKPTPIRPVSEPESISTPASLFPAAATTVVSASSSSTAASSSSDTIPGPTKSPASAPVPQSDSESESESESEPEPVNSSNKQVAPQPVETDSESESESESETDVPPVTPTPTPKPKPAPPPPAKRPAEADTPKVGVSSSVKRAKKDESEPAKDKPVQEPTPKKLFERLWSNEDELLILKGLNDYKDKKGIDPMTNVDDFVVFIKKYVHVPDANKTQIVGKVRRLKKRFGTANKRKKITDPHEIKCFELGKKVWNVEDGVGVGVVVAEPKKKSGVKVGDGEKAKKVASVVEVVAEEKGKGKDKGVEMEMEMEVELGLGFGVESGTVLREAMKRVEGEEKKEMRTMVEKANVAYLDAYLLRLKVLEVAAKKILDGINNDQC